MYYTHFLISSLISTIIGGIGYTGSAQSVSELGGAKSADMVNFPVDSTAVGLTDTVHSDSISVMDESSLDTLTISRYKANASVPMIQPVMADSVDIYGNYYEPLDQLQALIPQRFDSDRLTEIACGEDGFFTFDEEGEVYRTFQSSLLTTTYEHVALVVDSDAPFQISLDGTSVAQSDYGVKGRSYILRLLPSANRILTFTTLAKKGDQFRLRLVPYFGKSTTLDLRLDDQEYMSLDFDLSGESLSGVKVSPSGRYFTVVSTYKKNLTTSSTRYLYRDGVRRGVLAGKLYSASWMPKSDLLYTTQETAEGQRQLVAIDPETLEEKILSESIPSGDFVFTPDEKALIYFPEVKGTYENEYVDLVQGRYDHRDTKANRDITLLSHFDIQTGLLRPLTYGYRGTYLVSIAPNSRELIFSSPRRIAQTPFEASDYFTLNLETLETDTLFTEAYHFSDIQYTNRKGYFLVTGDPDAFGGVGRDLPKGVIANSSDTQLYLYNSLTKDVKPLTKEFDPSVTSVLVSRDSYEALFLATDQDYQHLYRVNLESGKIMPLPTTEELIQTYGASKDLKCVVYEGESSNNSDRLYAIKDQKEKVLYDLASKRLEDVTLGTVKDWVYVMPDGQKVPGRYYLPPNFDPNKKYPLLVYYYGGTSPSARLFDWYYSAPMYAAQGYVFLTLNPSGTTGWGQAYSARHVNAWGDLTANEIIKATQGFAQEMPFVNESKIGCFGASYGGFMTQYLLTQTDLFAAAVSHAGISNISSYWGQGTWGIGYSTYASAGSFPWNNPDLYAKHSPLFNADKIHTPLLLTHGDSDTNVPYGESVQLYNALRILGREVELLRVFGQDHHINELHRRQKWVWSMMAWFQKHLKDDPTWWNDLYPEVHY